MQVYLGQLVEDVGYPLEGRETVKDVLTRAEAPVSTVVFAGDMRKPAQLHGAQHAVGDGDLQHRGMALDVEAVLQAQRLELVLAQRTDEEALGLLPELPCALVDQAAVDRLVLVHALSRQPDGRPKEDGKKTIFAGRTHEANE